MRQAGLLGPLDPSDDGDDSSVNTVRLCLAESDVEVSADQIVVSDYEKHWATRSGARSLMG